jgi:hypothetical protein
VRQPVGLEALGASWWSAFDAAEAALWGARGSLGAAELGGRMRALSAERCSTVELLEAVARVDGKPARFSRLLLSRTGLRRVLGLPGAVSACVFSLDGVLVASAPLHLAAWAETLDTFISARVERTGGRFAPFNPRTDEERIHGKPRLEGVRAFLESRGISGRSDRSRRAAQARRGPRRRQSRRPARARPPVGPVERVLGSGAACSRAVPSMP